MKTNTINEGKGDEITKNMLENKYGYMKIMMLKCVVFKFCQQRK
jgi:hypothetical protein